MPKRKNDNGQDGSPATQEAAADPATAFRDELVQAFWQDAVRTALDNRNTAESCVRRACKVAGHCRIICTPGRRLECGGGDI